MTTEAAAVKTIAGLAAAVALSGAVATPVQAARTFDNPLEQREPARAATKTAQCKAAMLRGNGALVELLVTCGGKSVMVSYSPVSNEYCDPKMRCYSSLSPITERYMKASR